MKEEGRIGQKKTHNRMRRYNAQKQTNRNWECHKLCFTKYRTLQDQTTTSISFYKAISLVTF